MDLTMPANWYEGQRKRREIAADFLNQAMWIIQQPGYVPSTSDLLLSSIAWSLQEMNTREAAK